MEQVNNKDYGLPPKEALILEEYREQRILFEKLLRIVKRILRESIEENKIYINAIEGRVKAEDSLAGKLERKSGKYNSLSDLTDILGVRVITFYSDEVDKIAALVGRIFAIDWVNSIDKRKMHEIHSFGYNSLHYICRLPKEKYFDPEYPQLNEIRFEVQMRTALQHVWSVLDHDTGYKSGFEVPKEYLRNLNRLAGMLELVDEQFCLIRSGINDYRRQVQSLVSSGSFDEVELNGDSFSNYLELRPFDTLNKRIASINQAEIHETSLSRFLSVFVSFGFKTLGDRLPVSEHRPRHHQLVARRHLALLRPCAQARRRRTGADPFPGNAQRRFREQQAPRRRLVPRRAEPVVHEEMTSRN